ncbi:hypothetical protein SAY86_027490 [Trapa natans]|uniref:Zinc finger PHD-type domain-containing protein n=1 Tax=Trapa natans TaxID=22666 RepID=A0AAN7QM97_TRANT|nr:hypothetical protein SAY86_027490 [Trapa natans]
MPPSEAAYVSEHSEMKDCKEKLLSVHPTYCVELPLPSGSADITTGSDHADEVRVCDICGDVGREHLLAICTKCIDGVEHIYCMCVKMDKVPYGDWLCED